MHIKCTKLEVIRDQEMYLKFIYKINSALAAGVHLFHHIIFNGVVQCTVFSKDTKCTNHNNYYRLD